MIEMLRILYIKQAVKNFIGEGGVGEALKITCHHVGNIVIIFVS